MLSSKTIERINPLTIGLVVFSLIFLVYSNTLDVPWHLDDLPNIVNNFPIHIDNLMPETLWQTLHARPFKPGFLYRPVASLSFALNWYIGQDNTLGYHIINILIHLFTTLILFRTIQLFFQTPSLKEYSRSDGYFIALLAAVLWAVNPIQTQAITYIVQRMALLAAMFFVWSMFWYLKFRLASTPSEQRRYILFCSFCYLLAIGSKENAVILPLSLILLEYTFFPAPQDLLFKKTRKILLLAGTGIIFLAILYIFQRDIVSHFFQPVGSRPFSYYERLLTEPSILLFYLSLIFYPVFQRFSVDHEVTIAHSLFDKWSTIPSILIILFLLFFCLLRLRKQPLLGFAVLFFFINHLVESTIIPLELIFEHRNYLPSMFIFLPVAAWLVHLLDYYRQRSPLVYSIIVVFIVLVLTLTGWNTYLRNRVWESEKSLWQDALQKAPNNARPLSKLAEIAGWAPERSPEKLALAIRYYQKALKAYTPRTSFKAAILGNMGEVCFMYGLYDRAIDYYRQSLSLNPNFNNSQYGLVKALVMKGEFNKAIGEVSNALATNHFQSRFLNLGGLAFLWLQKTDSALWSFQEAMRTSPDKRAYYYNLGVALSKAGYHERAKWFLEKSLKMHPRDIKILFSLLENSIRAKNTLWINIVSDRIIQGFSMPFIENTLESMQRDYRNVPISTDLISPVIRHKIQQQAQALSKTE